RGVDVNTILALDDAMAFVLDADVLDRGAACLQRLDHLLGFADRHTGVPGAVDHDEGRADLIDAVDGRELTEQVGVLLRVAVLYGPELAAPGTGILQEGHEIGDTAD